MVIVYQGGRLSNSYFAAIEIGKSLFGSKSFELVGAVTASQTVEELESGRADIAVLARSNSSSGTSEEVSAALKGKVYHVASSAFRKIEHCLYCHPRADVKKIKKVISHPQALAQCEQSIGRLYPGAKLIKGVDTAICAKAIKKNGDQETAVICPRQAGDQLGLKLINSHVQDCFDNSTKFIALDSISSEKSSWVTRILRAMSNVPVFGKWCSWRAVRKQVIGYWSWTALPEGGACENEKKKGILMIASAKKGMMSLKAWNSNGQMSAESVNGDCFISARGKICASFEYILKGRDERQKGYLTLKSQEREQKARVNSMRGKFVNKKNMSGSGSVHLFRINRRHFEKIKKRYEQRGLDG